MGGKNRGACWAGEITRGMVRGQQIIEKAAFTRLFKNIQMQGT
jgi:hypothetical protein